MSMLTGRELEFLASLQTNWRRLYLSEVGRLLKQDDTCDDLPEVPSSRQPQGKYQMSRHAWTSGGAVRSTAASVRPVPVLGTSKATIRAAEGIARAARTDALVMTSRFLSSGWGSGSRVTSLLG